jgi:hypothetical protein
MASIDSGIAATRATPRCLTGLDEAPTWVTPQAPLFGGKARTHFSLAMLN